MNKGTTKIKAIAKRALEIREKGGFKTETITKKRYNVAYIPDAIKQAAKELKTPGTAKRTKRVVKTSAFKPVITNIYVKAYRKVKEKHSDAIVLLRVGDFFETFDVDAKIISEKLNITLIKTKSRYHCAGFPN